MVANYFIILLLHALILLLNLFLCNETWLFSMVLLPRILLSFMHKLTCFNQVKISMYAMYYEDKHDIAKGNSLFCDLHVGCGLFKPELFLFETEPVAPRSFFYCRQCIFNGIRTIL